MYPCHILYLLVRPCFYRHVRPVYTQESDYYAHVDRIDAQ